MPTSTRAIKALIGASDALYRASRRRADTGHEGELVAILVTALATTLRDGRIDAGSLRAWIVAVAGWKVPA